MKLKEKIYRKLDGARGRSFSGEELAEEFGVSRNAVWKAVKSLQAEGFAIAAASNRGYSLEAENDKLTPSGIEKFLAGGEYRISVADSTGSVLDDLKEAAAKGAPAWSVRRAADQLTQYGAGLPAPFSISVQEWEHGEDLGRQKRGSAGQIRRRAELEHRRG